MTKITNDELIVVNKVVNMFSPSVCRVRVEGLAESSANHIAQELKNFGVRSIIVVDQTKQLDDLIEFRNYGGDRLAFLYVKDIGIEVNPSISTTTSKVELSEAMQKRFDKLYFKECDNKLLCGD